MLLMSLFVVLAACAGEEGTAPPSSTNVYSGPPVTPVEKPQGVPAQAALVEETTTLGRIEREAPGQTERIDTRRLQGASCRNDVIVFETSEETIYAARSCDGFWDAAAQNAFVEHDVAIVLELTDRRFGILIETLEGAQGEFTVGGIWVE